MVALDAAAASTSRRSAARSGSPPGVSFTSFALVDCVAVLGVAVADGLEINLLGLARAALPTPAAPLAQLELALLARFSIPRGRALGAGASSPTTRGCSPATCRLTGGFAYVSWFKGDKAGEFVLTVGGYHPSFHRDGYPVVPRRGLPLGGRQGPRRSRARRYFALTSEAIMAGARLEASLDAGPLWAYLRLGGDGIVFFDPFRFEVTASRRARRRDHGRHRPRAGSATSGSRSRSTCTPR